MLNPKHLYYFHIFAQELNTGKAARRLGITSPSLSNQLKELEGSVGVPLSRRVNGKVVFSEFGEMLVHYSDRMFSAYDELTLKLSATKGIKETSLRVGISANVGTRFSFDLLALFEKTNLSRANQINVDFSLGEEISAGFAAKQYDLVLGAFGPNRFNSNDSISSHLIYPVRLFASHSLMGGANSKELLLLNEFEEIIRFANANQIALILTKESTVLWDETELNFSKSKVRPLRTIECNSAGGIVQLIERGLGIGFVPTPSLLDFKSARDLIVLGPKKGFWNHQISIFIQKTHKLAMASNSDLAKIL